LILFVVLEGRVYYVNEHGGCAEVVTADGAIKRLLYHEARDLLVVVTEGMVLSQFSVDTDGMLTEITKVSRLPLLTPRSPIIGQVS
jgi:intraflagellar transport protein 140